jgi:hypothetical protein
MKDFLSNLVARSIGSAPVIRPRLPSLFEPVTRYAGSLGESSPVVVNERPSTFEESEWSEQNNASSSPPEPRRRQGPPASDWRAGAAIPDPVPPTAASPRAGRSLPAFPPQPLDLDARREPPQRAEYPEIPIVRQAEPARPRESLPAIHEESPPAPVVSAAKSAPLALFAEIARNEKRLREGVVSEAHPRPLTAPESVANTEAWPSTGSASLQVPEPSATTPARRRSPLHQGTPPNLPASLGAGPLNTPQTSSRALPAIELPAALRFEFARHIPPLQRPGPPEPTIQVTIGRIDVRAITPQTSSARERPASPVMSLGDYLRSKRGEA